VAPEIGTVARVDAASWTLTLAPTLSGTPLVGVSATYVGAPKSGRAGFYFHVAADPPHFDFAQLRRSLVRAQFYVPGTGTLRAHVEMGGKRRSAFVERIVIGAGVKSLRVEVRGRAPRRARLVVRYTARGGAPVERSVRLRP
jgi:hypothetical protein